MTYYYENIMCKQINVSCQQTQSQAFDHKYGYCRNCELCVCDQLCKQINISSQAFYRKYGYCRNCELKLCVCNQLYHKKKNKL